MMKAVTSQLMLLQDFGKIGVFVKLRKTFRNSQNWETPMFFLVCWKPHYVAEKWQHHKVAQKLPKGGKLETSVILRKFPKMRRQKIKFLILQTKDILWSCPCFARSIDSSSIQVILTTWYYLYHCLLSPHPILGEFVNNWWSYLSNLTLQKSKYLFFIGNYNFSK